MAEVARTLNVSYHAVESRAQNIVQSKPEVHLFLGQLIDDHYLELIAEEINEVLQQNGQISVVELTKQYDLPIEFLLQVFLLSTEKEISL